MNLTDRITQIKHKLLGSARRDFTPDFNSSDCQINTLANYQIIKLPFPPFQRKHQIIHRTNHQIWLKGVMTQIFFFGYSG